MPEQFMMVSDVLCPRSRAERMKELTEYMSLPWKTDPEDDNVILDKDGRPVLQLTPMKSDDEIGDEYATFIVAAANQFVQSPEAPETKKCDCGRPLSTHHWCKVCDNDE